MLKHIPAWGPSPFTLCDTNISRLDDDYDDDEDDDDDVNDDDDDPQLEEAPSGGPFQLLCRKCFPI